MGEAVFHFEVGLALAHEPGAGLRLVVPLFDVTKFPIVLLHLLLDRAKPLLLSLGVGRVSVDFIQVVD